MAQFCSTCSRFVVWSNPANGELCTQCGKLIEVETGADLTFPQDTPAGEDWDNAVGVTWDTTAQSIPEPTVESKPGGDPEPEVTRPSTRGSTAPSPPANFADPLIGTRLGPAVIKGVIGQGGMGKVYLGWHERLEVHVAIKTILRRHGDDSMFVRRFTREARVAAKFQNAHIVKVMDCGSTDGVHYMVMEFVDGQNLHEYVLSKDERRLGEAEALDLLRQVADGLQDAEKRKVVHRDIKPGNLLVEQRDSGPFVRITDFGIVKELDNELDATMTHQTAVGTPRYMSPEQLRLQDLDARCDMFALGASFYHLVTQKSPAEGTSSDEVRRDKMNREFLSVRELLGEDAVSEGFDTIIRTMTQLERDNRYRTFGELIEAIDKVKAGRRVKAPPRRAESDPFWRIAAAVVFTLAIASVLGIFAFDSLWKSKAAADDPLGVATAQLRELRPDGDEARFRALGRDAGNAIDREPAEVWKLSGMDVAKRDLESIRAEAIELASFHELCSKAQRDIDAQPAPYDAILDSVRTRQRELASAVEKLDSSTLLLDLRRRFTELESTVRDVSRVFQDLASAEQTFVDRTDTAGRIVAKLQRLQSQPGAEVLTGEIEGLVQVVTSRHQEFAGRVTAARSKLAESGPSAVANATADLSRERGFFDAQLARALRDLENDVRHARDIESRVIGLRAKLAEVRDGSPPFKALDEFDREWRAIRRDALPAIERWVAGLVPELDAGSELERSTCEQLATAWNGIRDAATGADAKRAAELERELDELELGAQRVVRVFGADVVTRRGLPATDATAEIRSLLEQARTDPAGTDSYGWTGPQADRWPKSVLRPAGLMPVEASGVRYEWQDRPGDVFVLGKHGSRYVLVQQRLVRAGEFSAFLNAKRILSSLRRSDVAKQAEADPNAPIRGGLTLDDATLYAHGAFRLRMEVPTREELEACQALLDPRPDGIDELISVGDQRTTRQVVGATATKLPKEPRLPTAKTVGFRCCYPLR